jgi:probable HAF family extracellular repeat protein
MIEFTRRFWLASALGNLVYWLPGCGRPASQVRGTDADALSRLDAEAGSVPVPTYVLVPVPDQTTLASGIDATGRVSGQIKTSVHRCHACLWGPDSSVPHDLDNPSGVWSRSRAINRNGEVVGEFQTGPSGNIRAFLWTGGSMQHLKAPGSGESRAFAINDDGLVAGSSAGQDRRCHAVLWHHQELIPLEPLGATYTEAQALALNEHGHAVGSSFDVRVGRAVVWRTRGKPEELAVSWRDRAREIPSIATAVNNASHIVGSYGDGAKTTIHACRWIGEEFADLHAAGLGGLSVATSIDESSRVVGFYTSHKGDDRAFLYAHGKMHDLNTLLTDSGGLVLRYAKMIDDRGWIVGVGSMGQNSEPRAFVIRPV